MSTRIVIDPNWIDRTLQERLDDENNRMDDNLFSTLMDLGFVADENVGDQWDLLTSLNKNDKLKLRLAYDLAANTIH